jgi:hypothetical protein
MKEAMEKAIGRRFKQAGFPWSILRTGGVVYPLWREVFAMRYLWERPHRLDGAKLESLVGRLSQTPLDAAIAQALADLGILPSARAA